jgi:NDP-sugar pyrophosphorylase family protein
LKAAPLLHTAPFILLNVDILTNADLDAMARFHLQNQSLATLATSNRTTSRYLLFDDENRLCGWRNTNTGEEKGSPLPGGKTKHPKAFSGLHIIDPAIFYLIQRRGKFSMIDVYLDLMYTQNILSFDDSGSRFVDVGKPESIAVAESIFE